MGAHVSSEPVEGVEAIGSCYRQSEVERIAGEISKHSPLVTRINNRVASVQGETVSLSRCLCRRISPVHPGSCPVVIPAEPLAVVLFVSLL